MALARSPEALAAEYLLHGTDAVAWVEGGNEREGFKRAADVQFWKEVFRFARAGETFYFKPYGAKAEVSAIARVIAARSLSRVVACMDRDYDHLTGNLLQDSNVIYTRLYSWENEVWIPEVLLQFCEDVYAGELPQELVDDLAKQRTHLQETMRWYVRADALLATGGLPRYLSSERRKVVQQKKRNLPCLETKPLRKHRGKQRIKFRRPGLTTSVEADCIGHLIADFYFQTIRILLYKHAKLRALPEELARVSMITKFSVSVLKTGPCSIYYKRMLSSLRMT